ncbi:ThiF family adenylyltransferase [bacterium]|nr:ThiF family adenylyltransferase [bacterium]
MSTHLTFLPVETADLAGSQWHIVVIGAGGTGSWILNGLARLLGAEGDNQRLAAHRIAAVTAIDDDIVRSHNIGRQLFAPSEIGKGKAAALTQRYNRAFGLDFAYIQKRVTTENFWGLIPQGNFREPTLIIGAVDENRSRVAIHENLLAYSQQGHSRRAVVWIDSGNGENYGQVVWGNTQNAAEVSRGLTAATAEYVPYPPLVFPELLDTSLDGQGMDCDTPGAGNQQGFNINAIMGSLVLEMLVQMLEGRLTRHFAYVNLKAFQMNSQALTKDWLMKISTEASGAFENIRS